MRDPVAYADAIYSTAYAARLCPDVLLRAFGNVYPVHRVILASQSAYFATLLRWVSWQPSVGRVATVEEEFACLPSHELVLGEDVTQRGFDWIIEYFYASPHVAIASDNAFDVLAAAHYLGVTAVQTACVQFLSQHLDPHNFGACLMWATRADHGEASDMLAASCRRLLALRLPRNLPAWAPALVYIEPQTLLDILSSDHLAVPTEYDRYELVKEVVRLFDAAAAAADISGGGALEVGADDGSLVRGSSRPADEGVCSELGSGAASCSSSAGSGTLEVQRMLSSALHLSDGGLARHLQLARPCTPVAPSSQPAPAAVAAVAATLARVTSGSGVGYGSGGGLCDGAGGASCDGGSRGICSSASPAVSTTGTLPSDYTDESGVGVSSQTSSRSTVRLTESIKDAEEGAMTDARNDAGSDGSKAAQSVTAGCGAAVANAPTERSLTAGWPSPPAALTAVAASCVQLLLHEAVRYEHLTVPQLMEVQLEGLVTPQVLHAALWTRIRLDYQIHARAAGSQSRAAAGDTGRAGEGGGVASNPEPATGGGRGSNDAAPRYGMAAALVGAGVDRGGALVLPQQPRVRPFRICWRLSCGSLKKLQPPNMLQSEPHQYAGALWQVRLCCSDGVRGHLGLYVGRHLASTANPGGVRGQASPLPHPAGPPGAARQPPQQHPRHQHRQQQIHAQQLQPAPSPAPFISYADQQSVLRGRCRVSIFQSDNTALQGRLCLGDSDDFTADFAAGGYFGQARLLPRADVSSLHDNSEVLIFVSLQAVVGEPGDEAATR